jgi:hypothetical protein
VQIGTSRPRPVGRRRTVVHSPNRYSRSMRLPRPVHRRLEHALVGLMQPPGSQEDFSQPSGEPAFTAPDSVSWRIFKNPLVLFVGGVAGVVLELAEPRVRTGVWDHSSFREQPLRRLQRTALAAMLSVYGARSRAEAMIARVRSLHEAVQGTTAAGERYRANDPELLTWVHATASFGLLDACGAGLCQPDALRATLAGGAAEICRLTIGLCTPVSGATSLVIREAPISVALSLVSERIGQQQLDRILVHDLQNVCRWLAVGQQVVHIGEAAATHHAAAIEL